MIWQAWGGSCELAAGRDRAPAGPAIGCNGCVSLEPDVYFVADHVAARRWAPEAKRLGLFTLTIQRPEKELKKRKIEWAHAFFKMGEPFCPYSMSGLWCVEYAALVQRASCVCLLGMCGYGVPYFDGYEPEHKVLPVEEHNRRIGLATQRIVRKYPDVRFFCYGVPRYEVAADNWRVIPL